jgi:hypothetical protein
MRVGRGRLVPCSASLAVRSTTGCRNDRVVRAGVGGAAVQSRKVTTQIRVIADYAGPRVR